MKWPPQMPPLQLAEIKSFLPNRLKTGVTKRANFDQETAIATVSSLYEWCERAGAVGLCCARPVQLLALLYVGHRPVRLPISSARCCKHHFSV